MKWIAILSLGWASTAFASKPSYELKMNLSLDGKHVSSPHVVVEEGRSATIVQQNGNKMEFVEVFVSKNSAGLKMKFNIGTIDENGEKKSVTRPEVVVQEGKMAKLVKSNPETGREQFSFSVVANKKDI